MSIYHSTFTRGKTKRDPSFSEKPHRLRPFLVVQETSKVDRERRRGVTSQSATEVSRGAIPIHRNHALRYIPKISDIPVENFPPNEDFDLIEHSRGLLEFITAPLECIRGCVRGVKYRLYAEGSPGRLRAPFNLGETCNSDLPVLSS